VDPRSNVVFLDARAGDPRAFRALIEALAPDLVRFTSFLLEGDRDGAQDVVQEVLIEAWRQLARLESAEHLRRWSYRVARCRAASWKRRHGLRWRRLQQLSTVEDSAELTPWRAQRPRSAEHVRERTAEFRALRHALTACPATTAPIQLHYLQGFGLRETAALLGVSVASVKRPCAPARACDARSRRGARLRCRGTQAAAAKEEPLRPDRLCPRRSAPGERALVERLLALARRTREQPMDPDLPDRVLAALGLPAPRGPGPERAARRAPARRAALALGLLATLGLLLLPPGDEAAARRAQTPLFGAPASMNPIQPATRPAPASRQLGPTR
jgi:RNA polymerase sigma-70 factor (ECF subfamily)